MEGTSPIPRRELGGSSLRDNGIPSLLVSPTSECRGIVLLFSSNISRIKEKERETEREIEKDSRPPFDQTSILFGSHQNASIIYRASKHLMKNLFSFSFHVNSVLQSLRVYLRMFNSSTFIIPIDSAIGTQQRNGFAL